MFVWTLTTSGWTTSAGRIQGQQWWPVGGATRCSAWILMFLFGASRGMSEQIPWNSTFHQTLDVPFEIQVCSHIFNPQVLPPMFFASSLHSRQDVALVQDITLASRAAVGALVQQSTNNVGRHVLRGWVGWCLDQHIFFEKWHSAMVNKGSNVPWSRQVFVYVHKELGFTGFDNTFWYFVALIG